MQTNPQDRFFYQPLIVMMDYFDRIIFSNTVPNILPAYPPPPHPQTLGMGSIGQKSTFSEHGHVAYQIKGNYKMQQHGRKIFACRPTPLTLGLESKGQISSFSEHGHVAYQIKGNHEMQQHGSKYFGCTPPPSPTTLGNGSIGQNLTFSDHGHIAYQIK